MSDLLLSCIGVLICAAVSVLGYKQHFTPNLRLKPRLVPWMLISLATLATGFMLLVHVVNLLGFETGR